MPPSTHEPPDAETFARYLRRLDDDALAAFVAAVWEARGWTATREAGLVRVTDGATERVLAPVAGSRVPGRPSPPDADRVDAVVTAAEADRVAPLAADLDAEVLTAGDLQRMLRYAVDPDAAADLCATHLGARPGEMRPPLRRRVGALRSRAPAPGTVLSVALLAVAVAGVVWLLTAGGPLTGDQPTPPTVAPADGGPDDDPGDGTTTAPPPGAADVPGLSESGVTDLDELAETHEAYLLDAAYRRRSTYRGPDPLNHSGGPLLRNTVYETDRTRWRAKVTTLRNDSERRVRETYYDGEAGYVARYDGEGFSYGPAEGGRMEPVLAVPARASDAAVRRYLDVERTRVVDTVVADGDRYFEVRGSGDPGAAPLADVSDYAVVALVHERGYVESLRATYEVETPNGTREARFRFSYDAVREATVDAPTWYERRWGGDPGTAGTTVREGDRTATATDGGTTPTTVAATATGAASASGAVAAPGPDARSPSARTARGGALAGTFVTEAISPPPR